MNWKRGLIRAWIVASVIWVAVAIFLFGPLPNKWAHDPVVVTYQGQQLEFPSNIPRAEVKKAIVSYITDWRAKQPKNVFDQFDKTPEQEAENVLGNYQPFSIWPRILRFLEFAVLPPILAGLVGASVWWVLRGFRIDSN